MLHIAICDDDREELKQLYRLIVKVLRKYAICHDITPFVSGERLLASPQDFHLIFLDIRMEGRDGIDIGKALYRKNRSVKVIFQTNFKEYCSAAINKSHAFGFMEKPVNMAELEEQIREFLETRENDQQIRLEFRHVYPDGRKQELKERINLSVEDILYFEYMKRDRDIKIHTLRGDFRHSSTINELEQRMHSFDFELCNRGLLVNLNKIKRIKRYDIILCDDTVIPLSQRRAIYFKNRLNEFARNLAL